jgi:hypothetical protein
MAITIKVIPPNILHDMVSRLPVDEYNYDLFMSFLKLPYHVFYPLLVRMCDGEISIYDFIPIYQDTGSLYKEEFPSFSISDMIINKFKGKLPDTIVLENTDGGQFLKDRLVFNANMDKDITISNDIYEYLFTYAKKTVISTIYENIRLHSEDYDYMRANNLNERQMKKEKQNLYFHILRGRLQ